METNFNRDKNINFLWKIFHDFYFYLINVFCFTTVFTRILQVLQCNSIIIPLTAQHYDSWFMQG